MSVDFWMGLAIGFAIGGLGALLAVWVMHVCMMNTLRAVMGSESEPQEAMQGRAE